MVTVNTAFDYKKTDTFILIKLLVCSPVQLYSLILNVGMKINYPLSTSSLTTSVLSYTMLEDDVSYEKLSSKLEKAEVQGLVM